MKNKWKVLPVLLLGVAEKAVELKFHEWNILKSYADSQLKHLELQYIVYWW
jgi:hypothetical protein